MALPDFIPDDQASSYPDFIPDEAAPTHSGPEASWLDTITNSLALSVPVAARTAGAGIDFVEDQTTGTHYGDRFMSDAERMINETNQRLNLAPNSNKQIASGLISGAPAFFGTMAVAPEALPIYFGGESFLNKRRDLTQRGASPYEANVGAGVEGLVSAASAYPLPGLFGGAASAPIRRIVGGAGTMGALSVPQTLTDIAVDKYALGEMPTRDEFGDRLLTGVKGGVAGGLLYGGATEAASRFAARGAQRARAADVETLSKQLQQADEGTPEAQIQSTVAEFAPTPIEPAKSPVNFTPQQPDIVPSESGPVEARTPDEIVTPMVPPALAERIRNASPPTAEGDAQFNALTQNDPYFATTQQDANDLVARQNLEQTPFRAAASQTFGNGDSFLTYTFDDSGQPLVLTTHTDPAKRGQGLGSDLLRSFADKMRSEGHSKISLESIPDEGVPQATLDRFYARNGFTPTGNGNEMSLGLSPEQTPFRAAADRVQAEQDARVNALEDARAQFPQTANEGFDYTNPETPGFAHPTAALPDIGVVSHGEAMVGLPGEHPFVNVKTSEIGVRPDLMQFKMSSPGKRATGTNDTDTIRSKQWDDLKGGTFVLWEPIDPKAPQPGAPEGLNMPEGQKYLTVDGHHRHEFAKRVGRQDLVAQILREADGYTLEEARIIGAEKNIAEGKGTIYDQAKFLRGTAESLGQDEAVARGKSLGQKSGAAQTIAFNATDRLFNTFVNPETKLTPEQARVIAETVPGDESLQIRGMQLAERGKPLDIIATTLTELKHDANREGTVQRDMFGNIESDPALRDAEARAENIIDHRRAASEAARSIRGNAKNPALATKIGEAAGVDIRKPDVLKRILKALDIEVKRWGDRQYRKFPDLKARIDSGASVETYDPLAFSKGGSKITALPPEPAAPEPAQPSLFKQTLQNEEGAIRIGKLQTPQGVQEVHDSPDAKFFDPKLRGAFRKQFIMPSTLAEKFPQFKPIYEAYVNENKTQARTANDLAATLRPYLDLLDTTRVDNLLEASRLASHASGQKTPLDAARLQRMGFSPEETAAFFSVRDTMDQSLDVLRKSFLIKAKGDPAKEAKINAYVDALAQHDYVPFGRFGDYFTSATDKTGKTVEFSMHKTRKEALLASGELRTRLLQHFSPNEIKVEFGKLNKIPSEAYDALPHDIASELFFLDKSNIDNKLPPRGFSAHFLEAKLTPGYEQDFKRSIASYVSGIAKYAAKAESAPKYKRGLENILEASYDKSQSAGDNKLYSYAKKYVDDVNSPTKANKTLATFMYHYYLGGNAKSALVNMTQPFTTTLPELKTLTKTPTLVFAKAMKQAGEYGVNREAFTQKHPELALALKRANDNGVIGDQAFRQMFDLAKQLPSGKPSTTATLSKLSTFMFDKAESFNRVHAFLAGYEGGKRQGQSGSMLQKTAEDFVTRTQFDYGTGARPEIIRNHPNAFIFRLWTANYLANMMKAAGHSFGPKGLWGAAKFAAPMLALSGAAGFPLINLIIKAAETSGVDPKREVRKELNANTLWGYGGDVADALIYGAPSLANVNIGGSIGLGNISPDLEEGPAAAAGRLALGVLVDPLQRVGRAYDIIDKGGSYARAGEALLPEAARSLSKAARYAVNGVTAPDGTLQVPRSQADLPMIAKTALGLTDTRVAKGFEKTHSEHVITDERNSRTQRFNRAAAEAALKYSGGSVEALWGTPAGRQLIQDLAQQNADSPPEYRIEPNEAAIKRHILQMLAPDAAMLLRTPKGARKAVADVMHNVQ